MVAVVFDCLRLHHYLYHMLMCPKPLGDIELKSLSDVSPWLQRLLLKIQSYDIVIKYVPGIKISGSLPPAELANIRLKSEA